VKLVKVAEHYLPWFKTPTQVPLYRDWATPLYDRRGTTYHGMAALFLHPMRQHTGQVVTMPASKEETPLGYMATSTGWDMLPFYADHEPTTGPAYDQLSVYDWIHALKYELEPGDAIFIRTGRWARRDAEGPWEVGGNEAGLHASTAPWLHARDVSFVGSDAALDVMPSQVEGVGLPVHMLTIIAMGVNLFDNQDLEALAETAAEQNRWEFMLVAGPLAVPGGTGSPINAIAIF